MTRPEELEVGLRNARLLGVLPELELAISDMQRAIDGKAERLLNAGELTEAMAKQLWVERAQLKSLLRRFTGRAHAETLE